jgi:hypothetical protein
VSAARRLGGFLLGLLLVAGIVAGVELRPAEDERTDPITTNGRLGEPVDTGDFELTVEKVRVTHALTFDDGFTSGPALRSKGVWVVLTATLVGGSNPVTYDDARLETPGGYAYELSGRTDSSLTLTDDVRIGPGIARRGAIVFELPPDRLAGARLRLGMASADRRLGPEALVDLELDAATTRRLVDRASKRIALTPVEFA